VIGSKYGYKPVTPATDGKGDLVVTLLFSEVMRTYSSNGKFKMKNRMLALALGLGMLMLVGCSSEKDLLVRNELGVPIDGATVYTYAGSKTLQVRQTNAFGRVKLTTEENQKLTGVNVMKHGYRPAFASMDGSKNETVVLRRDN
jgi:hypothetical protein